MNTRKGANGELFIDSIPDSPEKSNPSEKFSLAAPTAEAVESETAQTIEQESEIPAKEPESGRSAEEQDRAADRLSGLMKKAIEGANVDRAEGAVFSEKNKSYIQTFWKRIDAWDGDTEGFSFVMGETPMYLSELEVQGKKVGRKQVRIDATKVKRVMKDHPEMTVDTIKKLPELLNDPILVLDSKTVSGRLVLLGEVYAKGKPVTMVLEINPTTRSGNSTYVDVIKVASAYTRSNTQNLIDSSNVRLVNENESRVNDWLKVNRLRLPLPNTKSNSASTNSIPDSPEKSNPSEKKSSEKAGNAQFSLAKNEGDKEHPYTKVGARIIRGLAVEKAGITLNRKEAEALDRLSFLAWLLNRHRLSHRHFQDVIEDVLAR